MISTHGFGRPFTWLFFAVIPLALMLTIRLRSESFVGDDAYMTFRVAQNAIAGRGFVCNPGYAVLSTSTPAWAALVGGAARLTGTDPATAYRPISLFLESANILLLVWIASSRGAHPLRGFIAGCLYALSWHANLSAHIGMETPLFVLAQLAITAILLGSRSRGWRVLAGVIAGFAIVVRPEGALLPIALTAYLAWESKRPPWDVMIASAAVIAAFAAWLFAAYGSILPQAAIAKSLAYHREFGQAAGALADHLVLFFCAPAFQAGPLVNLAVVAVLGVTFYVGLRGVTASLRPALFLACYWTLFALLFALKNPLMFEWYAVSLEPFYAITFAWGITLLPTSAAALARRTSPRVLATAAAALVLIVALGRYDLDRSGPRLVLVDGPGGLRGWPALAGIEGGRILTLGPRRREDLYLQAARLIGDELTPASTVLAPEFGAFGYATKARMISSIGHVNPEVFAYLPTRRDEIGDHINNGVTERMLRGLGPDYVLSLETFIRGGLMRSAWFHGHYEEVAYFESGVFGSHGLYLFRERGLRPSASEANPPRAALLSAPTSRIVARRDAP